MCMDNLSKDIVFIIISFLPLQSLVKFCQTNKTFNQMIPICILIIQNAVQNYISLNRDTWYRLFMKTKWCCYPYYCPEMELMKAKKYNQKLDELIAKEKEATKLLRVKERKLESKIEIKKQKLNQLISQCDVGKTKLH